MTQELPDAENECTSKYAGESGSSPESSMRPAPGAEAGRQAREFAPSPAWLWNPCLGATAEDSRPRPDPAPFPSDQGPHAHGGCRARPPPPHPMHQAMDPKFGSSPWMRYPYYKEVTVPPFPPPPPGHPPFPPPPPHLFRPHHKHGYHHHRPHHHHHHHHHKHHPWYRFGPPHELFHSMPSGVPPNAGSESSQAGDPKSGHGFGRPWRLPRDEPFPPFQHSDESSPFSKFTPPAPSGEAASSSPSQTLNPFHHGTGTVHEPFMPPSPSPLLAPPHSNPHLGEAGYLAPLPKCVDKFTCDSDSKEDSNSRSLSGRQGLSPSESKASTPFSIKPHGGKAESLNKSEESEESSKRFRMSVDPEEPVPPHKKNKGWVGTVGDLKASDLTLGCDLIVMPASSSSKTQSSGREGYMDIDLEKLPSEYMKNMQTEILKCVKKESIKRMVLDAESGKPSECEQFKSVLKSKREQDEMDRKPHPCTHAFAQKLNTVGTGYSGALDLFTYGNGFKASAIKNELKEDPVKDSSHSSSFSASTTSPSCVHPMKSKTQNKYSFSVVEKEKKSKFAPIPFKVESVLLPREETARHRNPSSSPHSIPVHPSSEAASHLDPKLVRFMSKIGLSNYVLCLVDAWVDMNELQTITDSELKDIGLSEEACKQIRHGLLKFKGGRDEEVAQYIRTVGKLEEFIPLFSWVFIEDLYQMDMKELLRLGLPEGPCSRLLRALNRTKRTRGSTEIKSSPHSTEEEMMVNQSTEIDDHPPSRLLPPVPPDSANSLSGPCLPNVNQQRKKNADDEPVCLDDPPDSTSRMQAKHLSLPSVLIDKLKPSPKHFPMDMKAAIAGAISATHGACDGSIASIAPALTEVLTDLLKHQKLTD